MCNINLIVVRSHSLTEYKINYVRIYLLIYLKKEKETI